MYKIAAIPGDRIGPEVLAEGRKVLRSIEKVLVEGKTLTADLGGRSKTSEVGDAVIKTMSGT